MKEILSNYPQAIVLSGHIHNGFGVATTMDRAYGTLIDIPSYNETEYGVTDNGTGYQVDVYADRVHFRARNYMTSTWLPQYDVILGLRHFRLPPHWLLKRWRQLHRMTTPLRAGARLQKLSHPRRL